MREITPENAAEYLRETGRVPEGRGVQVRALGGGVSNVVLRVDVEGGPSFVLKQARERLRTKMLWVSRLERIWTERDAMTLLGSVLPEEAVPGALFSDEPNFLFAMTCAPDDSVVWKEQLLGGRLDPAVARRAGELLGTIHAATLTRDHPALAGRFADTTVFDELRVDPFYRTVAKAHPEIAPQINALIASMAETPHRCLVLGDFSPKNILVHSGGLTLVDFETAHAGDPAFDLGFFLSHLELKKMRADATFRDAVVAGAVLEDQERSRAAVLPFLTLTEEFVASYRSHAGPHAVLLDDYVDGGDNPPQAQGFEGVAVHMAACMLARVDGKSPVDYLDEPTRRFARSIALAMLRLAPRE